MRCPADESLEQNSPRVLDYTRYISHYNKDCLSDGLCSLDFFTIKIKSTNTISTKAVSCLLGCVAARDVRHCYPDRGTLQYSEGFSWVQSHSVRILRGCHLR